LIVAIFAARWLLGRDNLKEGVAGPNDDGGETTTVALKGHGEQWVHQEGKNFKLALISCENKVWVKRYI